MTKNVSLDNYDLQVAHDGHVKTTNTLVSIQSHQMHNELLMLTVTFWCSWPEIQIVATIDALVVSGLPALHWSFNSTIVRIIYFIYRVI